LTDDVPITSTIKQFWVKSREDWPGFFWQLINALALSHAFVLINASQETRANHTNEEIATAEHQLWSSYGQTATTTTANVWRQLFMA
jgi:hypothetical protein